MIADTILLGVKSRRKLTRVIHKHNVSILRKKEKKKKGKEKQPSFRFFSFQFFPRIGPIGEALKLQKTILVCCSSLPFCFGWSRFSSNCHAMNEDDEKGFIATSQQSNKIYYDRQ